MTPGISERAADLGIKTVARWILVAPAAVGGWYLSLLLGILLLHGLDTICPDRYLVSDHCVAGPAGVVQDGIEIFAASLSAVLVVYFAALLAPGHRSTVAWAAYIAGAAIATILAYTTTPGLPYFGALVCGFFTALHFRRR